MGRSLRCFVCLALLSSFLQAQCQSAVHLDCPCLLGGAVYSTTSYPKEIADTNFPLYSIAPTSDSSSTIKSCAKGLVVKVMRIEDETLCVVRTDTLAYLYRGVYQPLVKEGTQVEQGQALGIVTPSAPSQHRISFGAARDDIYLTEEELLHLLLPR